MTASALSTPAAAADHRRAAPTDLFWVLWTCAAALPWLLPAHLPPWPTFDAELIAAAALLAAAGWALWAVRGRWQVDALAAGFVLAACVPPLQALCGLLAFPAEAALASLYLTGFALALLVARHAEEAAPGRLIEALLASLALAALLSTGMALCQWLNVDIAGALVAGLPAGGRPAANVGQINNLATLLAWGLVALWWAYAHRKLGAAVGTLGAAFLLLGLALTQSRTGLLAAALLGAAAWFQAPQGAQPRPSRAAVLGLALWLAILVFAVGPMGAWLLDAGGRSLQDQVSPGKRPEIWRLAFEAIAQHPWIGQGWNQGVPAHVALAERFPALHVTVQHMHNLVLDLMLWNGVPLALLMIAGLVLWFRQQWRGRLSQDQRLLLLALGVFVLHAMLELPHVLAFFLVPVALMMGTLAAWRPARTLLRLPRPAVGVLVALHALALVLMFADYRRIEEDARAARFRAARIGFIPAPPAPEVHLLAGLQDAMTQLRQEPERGLSDAQLAAWRKAVVRYPSFGSLIRYARAAALRGEVDEAQWALRTLCLLDSEASCAQAQRHWQALIGEGFPELEKVAFPTPR